MTDRIRYLLNAITLVVIAAASFAMAYTLRFGGEVPNERWTHLLGACACATVVKLISFSWHRLDQGMNRYIGFHDLITLAKATTWSTLGLTLLDALFLPNESIPRGVILIDWGTTLVAVGLFRSSPRIWRDFRSHFDFSHDRQRVLIVGADHEGETLLRWLSCSKDRPCKALGFIDLNRNRVGHRIGGVPIVGAIEDLSSLIATHAIDEVLVTGDLNGKAVREVLAESQKLVTPVRVLPTYNQLLRGSVSVQPREVAIEDLLRRDSVELDDQAIGNWLADKVVLVTGSAGSIGSEICRQLLKYPINTLVALDRSETGQFFLERELLKIAPGKVDVVLADANEQERLEVVFETSQPDIVFHAAAYKHVPLMEKHPGEAIKNIALATKNLADAAEKFGVQSFVMVSTDKAVNPSSVMGSCKQLAERYVQAKSVGSTCKYSTVRFGNVLDSAGSVIPIFREQIAQGGPVTVTHADINRYFMMIPEASQLVIQAGQMGAGGEIFVLDMGEPVRIVDLAKDMIRLSGLKPEEDIEIKITGLRPGEKLYEELYNESEKHSPTIHQKIMVADSHAEPMVVLINHLKQLEEIAHCDPELVAEHLAKVVPKLVSPDENRRAA